MELKALPQCPVCSSPQRTALFDIESSQVQQCNGCGLRYLDPCLSPSAMKEAYESEESLLAYHSIHEGYYDYGDPDTPSQTLSEFTRELDLVEKLLDGRRPRSIFDVGFGNGFFLEVARRRGWSVQGIDSSATNAQLAHKKFGLDLQPGAWETFMPSPESVDAISFLDVVEHLPDPHAAIEKARVILKSGGVLLIAVPNDASFFSWLGRFVRSASLGLIKGGTNKLYLLEHVCYYNLQTLTRLAEAHGFSLGGSFLSSTDLKKYKLSLAGRLAGWIILTLGKLAGRQNRLIAAFRKTK